MPSHKQSISAQTLMESSQHQLRNKISILLGTIEIVRITENLSLTGIEDIERMRRACDDMLILVDDLSLLETK